MRLHCVSVAHSQFTQLKRDVKDWRRNLKITICCKTKLSCPLICLGEWMSPNLLTLKGHIPAESSQKDYYMSSRIGAAAWSLLLRTRSSSEPMKMETLLLPDALRTWFVRLLPCCTGLFSSTHNGCPKMPQVLVRQKYLAPFKVRKIHSHLYLLGKEKALSLYAKLFSLSWEKFSLLFTKELFRQEYLGPSVWKCE